MDKLKEIIEEFAKNGYLPDWLANELTLWVAVISLLIVIISGFIKTYKWFNKIWINSLISRDLNNHFFSNDDIVKHTKNYIRTRYQNTPPSIEQEPGVNFIAPARENLMPIFLKDVFSLDQKNNNKFYLLLGDTGFGKTTFLLNLLIRIRRKKLFAFKNTFHDAVLIPLGAKEIENEIENIKDKEKKIILLDALDEDVLAEKNLDLRLKELLKLTKQFKAIIITSRTQFFPKQSEEPYNTGLYSFGDGNEVYNFEKIYLSPFNKLEINLFLAKKYLPFRIKAFIKAKGIVSKCPNLMVRPMLLSYIDEFIKSNIVFKYSFQAYGELINRWIFRESNKPGIKDILVDYDKILKIFSIELAVNLYENRESRNGYFVNVNSDIFNCKAHYYSELNKFLTKDISLKEFDHNLFIGNSVKLRSKSLLNRDILGNYKFSHKSILEYFLALKCWEDLEFYNNFNFNGLDTCRLFLNEMILHNLKDVLVVLKSQNKPFQPNGISPTLLDSISSVEISSPKRGNYLNLFHNKKLVITIQVSENWINTINGFLHIILSESFNDNQIKFKYDSGISFRKDYLIANKLITTSSDPDKNSKPNYSKSQIPDLYDELLPVMVNLIPHFVDHFVLDEFDSIINLFNSYKIKKKEIYSPLSQSYLIDFITKNLPEDNLYANIFKNIIMENETPRSYTKTHFVNTFLPYFLGPISEGERIQDIVNSNDYLKNVVIMYNNLPECSISFKSITSMMIEDR